MVAPSISHQNVLTMFEAFRASLDEQNDRRERLVKLSRDITIQSKRVIFLLHRLLISSPTSNPPADASQDSATSFRQTELKAAKQAYAKIEEIKPLLRNIEKELEGQERDRYSAAIYAGLQEFIEALSFTHYVQHHTLISYSEVQAFMLNIPLPYEDYILGLSDLTGELMRFAISSIGIQGGSGHKSRAQEVSRFVGLCTSDFEKLTPYIKQLNKKLDVASESLKKIEKAAYGLAIRGTEYTETPPGWMDVGVRREVDGEADLDEDRSLV